MRDHRRMERLSLELGVRNEAETLASLRETLVAPRWSRWPRTVVSNDLAAAVDSRRHGQAARLEEELSLLVARTFSETEARIALARDAVSQALDAAWSADEAAVSMPVDTRFRYDFSPPVGWAPPLEGVFVALRNRSDRRRHVEQATWASIGPLTEHQVARGPLRPAGPP